MVEKKVFLQALLMTVLIFGIGLILGLFMEGMRSDNSEVALLNSEVSVLDQQLRVQSINNFNLSCDFVKNTTFKFADSVFEDAKQLEKYDSSRKFKDTFTPLHKKYDLLRFLLWSEAEGLRKKCGDTFHTIAYLYEYNTQEVDKRALQNYYSRYLTELKGKYPDKILLLPMAADFDISSIESFSEGYKIESFPVVIVDGKFILDNLERLEIIEQIVNSTTTNNTLTLQ